MVSVIMPTYNRAKEIPRAIESVLNQTYNDFELIIVDDGSTDNTQEIIETYQDSRIRYIKNTTAVHGASAARNIGIRESNGEYIAFNDSDDIWYNEKIEKQLAFLEQTLADVTFCALIRNRRRIPDSKFTQKDCNLERILASSFTSTQALFGKAECFKNCLFDEKMLRNVDWELVIRLIKEYKVIYQREILVELMVTEGSISSDYNNAIISMNYILHKHGELYKRCPGSLKRMRTLIKYQVALTKDIEIKKKMREDNSVRLLILWAKYHMLRYMYVLRFCFHDVIAVNTHHKEQVYG